MLNKLFNENCLDTMSRMQGNFIDLTITSPPYDNLRKYTGYSFEFEKIAGELFRVTKPGGVVVWVVGDATVKGSESGTSFRQALYFKDLGFNLHDTMIYSKNGITKNHNRYEQDFEYMFVFSKGRPKTFNPIKIPCSFPEIGRKREGKYSVTSEKMRAARSGNVRKPVGLEKIKGNIWRVSVGAGHSTRDKMAFRHPAIFPERLVHDHIISWSKEREVVYDPFMGSGTVAKMALVNNRQYIGSEISEEYNAIAVERLAGVTRKSEGVSKNVLTAPADVNVFDIITN